MLSPIIVGRSQEQAQLEHALTQAEDRQGRAIVVSGEAGIGKSRLVAELQHKAIARGFTIMHGRCFEHDERLPYAGLLDLLRHHLGMPAPGDPHQRLGPFATPLINLLPEYANIHTAQPTLLRDPQDERQRITQAFVQFVAQIVRDQPTILILEDLHWSDENTLHVLLTLARRLHDWPLLLVLSCRATPYLGAFIATIEREPTAQHILLTALDYEQTDRMLRAIFQQDHPIRGDFLTALYTLTEGNPFFLEEVLKALVANGDITLANGRWERKPLSELRIPASLHAAVQHRLLQIRPQLRELLGLAAVAGRRFDFELLQELTDQDEATLITHIRELIELQLVIEEAADLFAFRHQLTQAVLYSQLISRERRRLHGQIAITLEQIMEQRDPLVQQRWASDLARHFFEATLWQKSAHYSTIAANEAQRLYAPAAAREHLSQALHAYQQLGQPVSAALMRTRGMMHELTGNGEAALADYLAALQHARANQQTAEEAHTLLAIGFYYAARDVVRMGEYLSQSLDLARSLSDPLLLGYSLNRYGNWFLFQEQPDQALQYHQMALALFAQANHIPGLATTYDLLGVTHIMATNKQAALAYYQKAVDLFQQLGDQQGLASALAAMSLQGISYYHRTTIPATHDHSTSIQSGVQALQIARQIAWPSGQANALVYLALTHGPAGEYDQALACAGEAQQLAEQIDHPVWRVGALMARGAIAFDLLDFGLAHQLLEEAFRRTEGLGTFFRGRVAGYLAQIAIAEHQPGYARSILEPLLESAEALSTQGQRILWLANAELALAEANPPMALAISERLIASASQAANPTPGCVPSLWHLRGRTLTYLKQYAAAERDLQAAALEAVRLQLPGDHWRIQHSLGQLYQAQGQRSRARAAYTQAHAIVAQLAERISDPTIRLAYQRATVAYLPRLSAGGEQAIPGAAMLTKREREIAAMIAQGATSREIAGQLVLGERTIETHISNILGKLNFTSRREIAAWALNVGLARRVE
jgi:DNA-binding NarL/FixJ family response regulator